MCKFNSLILRKSLFSMLERFPNSAKLELRRAADRDLPPSLNPSPGNSRCAGQGIGIYTTQRWTLNGSALAAIRFILPMSISVCVSKSLIDSRAM